MTRGRKTRYLATYPAQAAKLAALGATETQMAEFFGVVDSTWYDWKVKHPKLQAAIKSAKLEADAQVEQSLFRRALGYDHDGRHYPADVKAGMWWLQNRQPLKWRDQKHMILAGEDGGPLVTTPVQLVINGVAADTSETQIKAGPDDDPSD